jgi:hypothetical protein
MMKSVSGNFRLGRCCLWDQICHCSSEMIAGVSFECNFDAGK